MERNLSRGNDSDGFECDGNCDENTFLRNVALNNGDVGFICPSSCDDNKFIKNLAAGNENEGFDVKGDPLSVFDLYLASPALPCVRIRLGGVPGDPPRFVGGLSRPVRVDPAASGPLGTGAPAPSIRSAP